MEQVQPGLVTGLNTGIRFPATLASLREAGADFLTQAMRAVGALAPDNAVSEIREFTEFFGGGMGRKATMTVAYAREEPGLDHELFVKITPEFDHELYRLGALMEPEVRFALLSRTPGFPLRVPHCYFADFSADPMCGLLITERVRYGEGEILPALEKALDWQLQDPLPIYRALVESAAALGGHHRQGRLGDAIDRQFPFKPDSGDHSIRPDPAEIAAKVEDMRALIAAAPNLFPTDLDVEAFLADIPLVFELKDAIARELNGEPDLISLCHWNLNVDNAWFERQADGSLVAGLLDWGSVAQMNIAQCFTGMITCAEPDFLARHERDLVTLLAERYNAAAGSNVSVDRLHYLIKLSFASHGVGMLIDAPPKIRQQCPDFASMSGRTDPRLYRNFRPRVSTLMLLVLISEWHNQDIGGALRELRRCPAVSGTRSVS